MLNTPPLTKGTTGDCYARFCEVTDLYTMMTFMQEATEILYSDRGASPRPITFIYLDIVNFKGFNQKYGFMQGNELLRYMAQLLKTTFEGSIIGRLNGDHFAVATQYPTDYIGLLIDSIQEALSAHESRRRIDIHAGIYSPPEDIKDISLILDRAKLACDSIKNTFEIAYAHFAESMEQSAELRNHIISSLHQALTERWVEIYYQPELQVASKKICGFEALARWNDPERGMISPAVFIPVLEDAQLSYRLDLYVVRSVCRHLARQRRDHPERELVSVSVNISRGDFYRIDMLKAIETIRQKYDIDCRLLHIEITESALSGDEDLVHAEVERFREAGYEIWLDDFGSGYSSLNNLSDFPVDVLKLDMVFLRRFAVNPKTKIIIRAVVNMAKELGMRSLVEGVETEEQFDFICGIGCDKAQGYLFSKPLPFDELQDFCYGEQAKYALESGTEKS